MSPSHPHLPHEWPRDAAGRIERLRREVELAISLTPTGPARTTLTEVNIRLLQARDALGAYDRARSAPGYEGP